MKILFLLLTSVVLVFGIDRYNNTNIRQMELRQNEAVFKAGFEAGIKALEFQRKNDGFKPKRVEINKAYYITYEITKMPYEEALFLQNIAAREGFDTHITKKYIFFGEFEREADARKAISDLNAKFQINAQLRQNQGGEFLTTYPKLWGDFYTYFVSEVKKLGYIDESECSKLNADANKNKANIASNANNTNVNTNTNANVNKKPKINVNTTTFFTLKNKKAMSYMNFDKTPQSRLDSYEYKESGLKSKQNFPMGNFNKPYKTIQGEQFYKVLNKNIYFSDKDVLPLKKEQKQ